NSSTMRPPCEFAPGWLSFWLSSHTGEVMTIAVPLEITGLTKVFHTPSGPFVAVQDVNASIEEGEFVCILGHSGCGKSTVLSIMAGLQQATLGGVVIDGQEVVTAGTDRAVVFQTPCLLPWLTAWQNVALAMKHGRPGMKRAERRAEAE